jgi:DNA-binding MarR family transcriptional regulator
VTHDLDPNLQHPARLRLMTMLTAVSEAEFSALRDNLDVADSVLSKHISALASVRYLTSRKGSHLGRRTTWVRLTPTGRRALAAHVAVLRAIIEQVEVASRTDERPGLSPGPFA